MLTFFLAPVAIAAGLFVCFAIVVAGSAIRYIPKLVEEAEEPAKERGAYRKRVAPERCRR